MRYYRFRPDSMPVLREPRSPIALRHWMSSWPSINLLFVVCFISSVVALCSSRRNATCITSRGLRMGECVRSFDPKASQFKEVDLKGGLGTRFTAYDMISLHSTDYVDVLTSSATVLSPKFSNCASSAYLPNPSFLRGKSPAFVLTPTSDCATN